MNRIELTRLWQRTTADGRTVIGGRLGSATIQIEQLAEPDERGATHVAYLVPAKENPPKREETRWVKQSRAEAALVSPTGQLAAYSSWCEPEKP